jgi:two-component system response regulator VicR
MGQKQRAENGKRAIKQRVSSILRDEPLVRGVFFAAPLVGGPMETNSAASQTQILVVDDNPDNAHIIRDYQEARGYPISVAYDGEQAMALFEQVKPSIVLLDVMMPGRDGWQVCREMKLNPARGKQIRVIMVTALDDWMNKRQALQTGADDYVEKPFELSKLAATVERNIAMLKTAT